MPAAVSSHETAANAARHLRNAARRNPDFCAVRVPFGHDRATGEIRYRAYSFADLDRLSDAAANHFAQRGILPNQRTLLLARPGIELISSMFALLKLGAVPVAIDPGMGMRAFLRCIKNIRPSALVGSFTALALTRLFPRTFADVRARIRIDSFKTLPPNTSERPLFNASSASPAAILFTSGSTGAPKGACYTHGMLDAQLSLVRDTYGIQPGEVDLPMLPVFALFNPALGTTTVTPEMNPSRPATADPEKIIRAIIQNSVTYSFGSPAVWTRIVHHCQRYNITLPSLRRVLVAGAPVTPRLLAALRTVFPNACVHTPYGATEALPVASIEASEVLAETAPLTTKGLGTCVGKPLARVRVAIIPLSNRPLASLDEAPFLPTGEAGEIIVQSPSCSCEYAENPEATALAKIPAPDGSIWHRMGDLGRFDDRGRLWFLGRKAELVTTPDGHLYTESCEAIFNTHPSVHRSALIGLGETGSQEPAIVIEPFPDQFPRNAAARTRLISELTELGSRHAPTRKIARFLFEKKFPVDTRHNAKIHRLTLRRKWSARLGFPLPAAAIQKK
ncbi:MAG: AMP-binding protein [Puniceicoccales bacterium]|jgi:acyl-CoA synthetase (AMP-forming)/AMP-acid ligase II|nr:AMP-binding protein [Puniceicoccales bacterium]